MEEPQQPVDQQVTSKTPETKQKNPKRVAAGKAIAERTRIAREAQKKALIEAQSLIAQAKKADPVADSPSVAEPPSSPASRTSIGDQKRSNNNTMAERYQHHRFIGGALLQTRRDQKTFFAKKSPAAATRASTC